jgi:hypothetical protein
MCVTGTGTDQARRKFRRIVITFAAAVFCVVAVPCVGYSATPDVACISHSKIDWNTAERIAWKQICLDSTIDLTKATQSDDKTLTAAFLETIVSDSAYTTYLHAGELKITGAVLGDGSVAYMSLHRLTLERCEGSLVLVNPTVTGLFNIENSRFGELRIRSGKIGNVLVYNSNIREFFLEETDSEGRGFLIGMFDYFRIISSHFHSDLTLDLHSQDVQIYRSTVDGAVSVTFRGIEGQLRLEDLKVGSTLALLTHEPPVTIRMFSTNVNTIEFIPLPENQIYSSANTIQLSGMTFSHWRPDIEKTVALLKRNETFDPPLFEQITKSYRSSGQYEDADRIQYLKKNIEFNHANGFARYFLFFSWITVGYGLWPSIGLAWFGALIVIGFLIFRSGEHALTSDYKPRSWLVFSLDTILPVIKLDSDHDKVQFKDWRQYCLYAMKVLSAVLVFLIAKILGDIIGGY